MWKIGFIFILAAASLGACNLPRQGGGDISQEDRVMTAAAQTVAALNTMRAPGYTPPPGSATVTPSATAQTPTPAGTASPTTTPTSSEPCNRASFEGDATIPDGSVLPPNTRFTKTWLVKNTGSCVWKGYSVVFAERGSALSGTAVYPLLAGSKAGRDCADFGRPGGSGRPGRIRGILAAALRPEPGIWHRA